MFGIPYHTTVTQANTDIRVYQERIFIIEKHGGGIVVQSRLEII